MKKDTLFIINICIVIVLLSGCWDKRLLKEHSLILGIGYDLNEDETIKKTVTFPRESINDTQAEEGGSSESESITIKGNTVGDADIQLERHLSQKFDRSKARVLLLGESLAEYGFFSILDSIYRDPRGPLGALVAIVSDTAESGLKIENKQTFFTSEFYYDLLISAEENGIIKCETVQSLSPNLLSGGKDISLPLISVDDDSAANIEGIALFSGDKMTGKLTANESIMYLILMDDIKRQVKLNLKISDNEPEYDEKFVTFAVRKENRKLKVSHEKDKIKANVVIDLNIEIEEYPLDHLYVQKRVEQLEKEITAQLTDVANKTIKQIQQANSDSLGIGEQVRAHHHSTWEKINWRDVYPHVPIDVKFNVDIVQQGIMN